MLKCLFWNQYRKELSEVIQLAASSMRLDIILTCESTPHPPTLSALKRVEEYWFTTGLISQRFHVFTRFPSQFVSIRHEAERYLILDLQLPARERFFLMVLHGPSKAAGWSGESLALEMSHFASSLRNMQETHQVSKVVVVGDFNMNPFDPGLVAASGFNAVMDARVAARGSRTVQHQEYAYFYNPMWNLLGDKTPGPPATTFVDRFTQIEQQWHMVDQVIVSPEMIQHIDVSSIRILDRIGENRLLTTSGRPAKSRFSDHLPLYFELTL